MRTTLRVTHEGREAFELSFHYIREHRAHMKRLLAEFDLTSTQMDAIRALKPGKPVSMVRLSAMIFCEPPNVTPGVNRLESQGLIERRADPEDRRLRTVALTAEGIEFRARLLRALREPPTMIASLTPDEQQMLRDLFRRMLESVEKPSTEGS